MGKSWREGWARLWSLVLHDLQGLGSLTKIWVHLSDAWDNPYYYLYKNICEITQEYKAQHPDIYISIIPQFKLFLETGEHRKWENLP